MPSLTGTWIEYLLVAAAAAVYCIYEWQTILAFVRAKLPPPDYEARAAELRRRHQKGQGEADLR